MIILDHRTTSEHLRALPVGTSVVDILPVVSPDVLSTLPTNIRAVTFKHSVSSEIVGALPTNVIHVAIWGCIS